MKRDTKAETRAINQILWRDWDPIGCGVPEDEYESYVWPVYKLLIDGAPPQAIEGYLRWVAETQIEIEPPEERVALVVDKLLALKLANSEEKYA
ncbi:MAG: hypothetical protein JNJ63_00050 [Hyphomonadaceae bacterium]|nr:hypothetical protein [Hyphomonadaceae bacterium]